MIIDSHSHLEMPDFKKDLEEVIQRAEASDVGFIFTVGTEKKDWRKALEIAHSHPYIYAILGVHPHHAKEIDHETYTTLRKLCRDEKVKAFGEIGLDFFRNLSPRDIQLKRFREQIGLAKELKLPIVIHDREAHQQTLEILKSERAEECGGIIHCFSGDMRWQRPASIEDSIFLFPEASHLRMRMVLERSSEGFLWNRFLLRRMPPF
jgi:TatD DNase family protein